MNCPKCGKPLRDGVSFCSHCGASVANLWGNVEVQRGEEEGKGKSGGDEGKSGKSTVSAPAPAPVRQPEAKPQTEPELTKPKPGTDTGTAQPQQPRAPQTKPQTGTKSGTQTGTKPPVQQKKKGAGGLVIALAAVVIVGLAAALLLPKVLGKKTESEAAEDTRLTLSGDDAQSTAEDAAQAAEAEKAVSVEYEHTSDNGTERLKLTGTSADGRTLWSYEDEQEQGQLDEFAEIGIVGDVYCFVDRGSVRALNLTDGSYAWLNDAFAGSVGDAQIGSDGRIYLTGYYGPDLFILDGDGATVYRMLQYDESIYWPFDIYVSDDCSTADITFEAGGGGTDPVVITVYLDDYSYSIPELDNALVAEYVIGAEATSVLDEPKYNITHSADLVLDCDTSTAWVEGVSGRGENESITIYLSELRQVSGFTIRNGYQKSGELYEKNSRVRQLRVTTAEGDEYVFDIDDITDEQAFYFDEPVWTASVTFTITETYAGTKYDDTAISEIWLF